MNDMLNTQEGDMLLDKALGDLLTAQTMAKLRPDVSCYHCSQCVEKLAKASLSYLGCEYEHTHKILTLFSQLQKITPLSYALQHSASKIAKFLPNLRYDSMRTDPTYGEAVSGVKEVASIIQQFKRMDNIGEYFVKAEYRHDLKIKRTENDLEPVFTAYKDEFSNFGLLKPETKNAILDINHENGAHTTIAEIKEKYHQLGRAKGNNPQDLRIGKAFEKYSIIVDDIKSVMLKQLHQEASAKGLQVNQLGSGGIKL